MKLRVLPKHMLVFAVRGKRKFKGLFMPQIGHYADYFQLQNVWIAEIGRGCNTAEEGVKVGSQACIMDVYELETLPKNVFQDYYRENPEAFEAVVEEARQHDGVITSEIIHEDSLIGLVEDECQISKLSSPSENLQ